MAKTMLQVAGQPEPIALEWQIDADGLFSVTLPDGESVCEGKLTVTAPGEGWLETDGRIRPFYMTQTDNTLTLWLDGQTYTLNLPSPGAPPRETRPHAALHEDIKAPMPGSIIQVLVQPGDTVKIHQPLVILESMKMEMTLSAHADATVRAVHCAAGQLAALGDVLVEWEP